MSWTHVSSSGAQVASSGQATLSATFPETIAAGDLIVVSVAYWYNSATPTVQDSVNSTSYTYIGQTPANNSGQIGTWYYVAANGGSNFQLTATSNGAQYLAMTIDAYSFTSGDVIRIDNNGYATGTSTTPTLSSALSVTASDLVYATCTLGAPSGTISPGSGFTIRYTAGNINGQTYGIAAEDSVNESSNITPSFGLVDSGGWGINAVVFKAAPQSVTIGGPTQGLYTVNQKFSLSLVAPSTTATVVTLASSNGSDTFQATSGGSNVTSITIPANASSANFYFTPSSTGTRNISITAGSISCPNSPYAYDALSNATSYTVTGATGGHQLVPVTWTITLTGGDFAGIITATPGGGLSQCQIFYPIVTTFTGNGALSKNFTFIPQNQDSVTFTFTNSGGLTNPSTKSYQSTIVYYTDQFSGTAGTSIASHVSNTLSTGVAGSGYTVTGSGTIELDGNGNVFLASAGDTYALTQATVPPWTESTSFEVLFDLNYMSGVGGTVGGLMLLDAGGNTFNFVFIPGSEIAFFSDGSTTYWLTTTMPSPGTLWHMKVTIIGGSSVGWYLYYSTDNVTWTELLGGTAWGFSSLPTAIGVGPYMQGTVVTATTGVHVGNITLRDIAPASPNCQIASASPVGTAGAYIGTSGQDIVFFFEQTSNGDAIYPTVLNYSPTVYRNGTSIGVAIKPWITGYHACAILQLAPGTQIASTDTVTITVPASWMTCGTGYASSAISSPMAIANYTGQSCFGTATLGKTFKPGFNFSDIGSTYGTLYNVPKNWRYRLGMPVYSTYPINMGGTTITPWFINYGPLGNGIDSTNYPGLAGYWAIGFDDNYIANSGVATQLSIVAVGGEYPGATVTQITGNNNPGTNGLGQYYLFEVQATPDSFTANIPLALQWVNFSGTSWVSNLWIVGPGDFVVPESNNTTWTFDRSNPFALSSTFLTRLANGAGSMRWLDATLGFANNCNMTQPWEEPSANALSWDTGFYPYYTIGFSEARPFVPSGSYIYQEFVAGQRGSTWTCSSGLSVAITSTTATTITINSAYTDPIFSGVLIQIDSEQMYVQSLPGATTSSGSTLTGPNTLTVIRGAFGTTSATHAVNATVTILSKRWALSSFSDLNVGATHFVEFVTTAPHGLQGPVMFQLGGNFPTFTYTDSTTSQYSGTVLSPGVTGPWVTGPNTFITIESVGSPTTGPVTLAATQSLSSSTSTTWSPSAGNGFPAEFIASATGNFPGTDLQVNIPLSATSAYIYDVAVKILNNFPAGRNVWLELADEPWNYFFEEYGFCLWLSNLSNYGESYYYYVVMRTGQIRTIFQNVFGSRASEIKTLINNQFGFAGVPWVSYTGTPSSTQIGQMDPLQLAAYLGVHVDARAVAPYTPLDGSAATIAAWNNATTIQQMVDLVIHDLYYCNNPQPGTGGWNAWMAAEKADIAAYTAATGIPCVLYGYEGGWGGPPNINNAWTISHDIVYDPNWLIIEQDMFALYQISGFARLNTYSYGIYYDGTNNWGVYHGPTQLPGKGDGSDGKANNRLCLATPGFEYSKAATTNQDQFCVSVRGQAFLEWMQPAQGKKRMLFVPYRFVNR